MNCHNCGQPGHLAWQCKWDKELADQLPAQFARCPDCKVIIYTWDRGIPCEKHRTVAGWRDYYHSGQFPADVAAAREQAHGTPTRTLGDDELVELAKQQVEEARAARQVLP